MPLLSLAQNREGWRGRQPWRGKIWRGRQAWRGKLFFPLPGFDELSPRFIFRARMNSALVSFFRQGWTQPSFKFPSWEGFGGCFFPSWSRFLFGRQDCVLCPRFFALAIEADILFIWMCQHLNKKIKAKSAPAVFFGRNALKEVINKFIYLFSNTINNSLFSLGLMEL